MKMSDRALLLAKAPDPMTVGAYTLANWCNNTNFQFSYEERKLINTILDRGFTCEPSNVHELRELRILFWQIVGCLRKEV